MGLKLGGGCVPVFRLAAPTFVGSRGSGAAAQPVNGYLVTGPRKGCVEIPTTRR
ncbi:hypothetical protein HRbin29_02184 [bacterium HR29]|jgi:hypothetical protein|nr:hypothetical protein HRbin29_02184 [bacterium HR29]